MSSSELGYSNGTSGSGSNSHFNVGNNNTITITTPSGHTNNNNIIINNNQNICNMVPIISVTPHSPSAKYNSILEDSLSHLQSIRETVVQMKNSSAQNTNFGNIGIINPTVIFVISSSWNLRNILTLFSWHRQRFSIHVHHYPISVYLMRYGLLLKMLWHTLWTTIDENHGQRLKILLTARKILTKGKRSQDFKKLKASNYLQIESTVVLA